MADAAVALSPYRAASGVRRGVRHNSYRRQDGPRSWRYDLFGPGSADTTDTRAAAYDFTTLWDDAGRITCPAMFVRGGLSKYVTDDDTDEMKRRIPGLRVEIVDGAGHAVQAVRLPGPGGKALAAWCRFFGLSSSVGGLARLRSAWLMSCCCWLSRFPLAL